MSRIAMISGRTAKISADHNTDVGFTVAPQTAQWLASRTDLYPLRNHSRTCSGSSVSRTTRASSAVSAFIYGDVGQHDNDPAGWRQPA